MTRDIRQNIWQNIRRGSSQLGCLLPLCLVLAASVLMASQRADARQDHFSWPAWGGDLSNQHYARDERRIAPDNVHRLRVKWVYRTTGNVSAIPTVAGDALYVPDWGWPYDAHALMGGGRLHAINRHSGRRIWRKPMSSYTLSPLNQLTRSSPALVGDLLIIGDLYGQMVAATSGLPLGHGAYLYAINRHTGKLVWRTRLDDHPFAQVTQSPVVHDGKIYVGVSSQETPAAKSFLYRCCSFRGSMLSLDVATGAIRWKTYMVPPLAASGDGFAGVAVWGSSPTVDEKRGVVYIGTGNNYRVPQALERCIKTSPAATIDVLTACKALWEPEDNRAESVVALDLESGEVRWQQKLGKVDAWNFGCRPDLGPFLPTNVSNCRLPEAAHDFDFGQGPMLITAEQAGTTSDLLVIGQKNGIFWALDPEEDGRLIWASHVGVGGLLGGIEFGAATDGKRIYTQITNVDHLPYKLIAGPSKGQVVNGGLWAALDVRTGRVLWQTPDPASFLPLQGGIVHPIWGIGRGDGFFGLAMGPLTVANGVVFAGSMDRKGHMYAMDAATGAILWRFASGGSIMSAPTIIDGVVYWGSGYHQGFNNNKLYAFALGG